MTELTEAAVRRALNEAADTVIDEVGIAPDTGKRDSINLVVNIALHWLFTNPDATLAEVIGANYDDSPETVLGWCAE